MPTNPASTPLVDFFWERTDADVPAPVVTRDASVAEVPGDRMTIQIFSDGSTSRTIFNVFALTQREGFVPVRWVGSRPITAEEFAAVADPHRYGFMFVTCVRRGVDLVCTPWSYHHAWEGPGTRRGEPVVLSNALTVRVDEKGREWVGIRRDADVLARVCAMVNHGMHGYTLRNSESGNAWTLEVSSTHPVWCAA